MLSHKSFLEQCAQQGVTLDGAINLPTKSMFAASQAFSDVLVAGRALASGGRIEDTSFCTDPISAGHAQLVNSNYSPNLTGGLVTTSCESSITGCADAELKFGQWLEDLASGQEVGGRIVVDDQYAPVVMQKGAKNENRYSKKYGETSGLLLQEVSVVYGGSNSFQPVTLPIGSLVALRPRAGTETKRLSILPFSKLQGLSFARMTGLQLNDSQWLSYYAGESCKKRPALLDFSSVRAIARAVLKKLV